MNDFYKFLDFYNSFDFQPTQLIKDSEGNIFWGKNVVQRNDEIVGEGSDFINVGYKSKNSKSRLLSNLCNYEFEFKGEKVQSIESVLQGLKFPELALQNEMHRYSGTFAVYLKDLTEYNWKETGKLYWKNHEIDRYSEEYRTFILELFFCASKNPLYRLALKRADKYILHSIGCENVNETVLTRFEFEHIINALAEFCKKYY